MYQAHIVSKNDLIIFVLSSGIFFRFQITQFVNILQENYYKLLYHNSQKLLEMVNCLLPHNSMSKFFSWKPFFFASQPILLRRSHVFEFVQDEIIDCEYVKKTFHGTPRIIISQRKGSNQFPFISMPTNNRSEFGYYQVQMKSTTFPQNRVIFTSAVKIFTLVLFPLNFVRSVTISNWGRSRDLLCYHQWGFAMILWSYVVLVRQWKFGVFHCEDLRYGSNGMTKAFDAVVALREKRKFIPIIDFCEKLLYHKTNLQNEIY